MLCLKFNSEIVWTSDLLFNTAGTDPSQIPSLDIRPQGTEESINYKNNIFDDGNATTAGIPVPRTQFKCDVSFYLPKIDSLFIDKTGKMILKSGEPSDSPTPPEDIATGIRLYDINMPAYTFSVNDIVTRKFNYRRYTMKDIFEIDRRVEKVEKLVVLSLLEISALNANVRDTGTGLDRFKNGVVVDSFVDHSKGDTGNDQYRCSIDPKLDHLRSPFYLDQMNLEEVNVTDEQRDKLGNYAQSNNIVTCKYETVPFISQPVATRARNIQKISTTSYEGKITLNPSFDTYYDSQIRPRLVIETNPVYSAMVNLTEDQVIASLGTVWRDWETNGRLKGKKTNITGREKIDTRIPSKTRKELTSLNGLSVPNVKQSSLMLHKGQEGSGFDVATGSVVPTSFGDRVVDIQVVKKMRSIPVYFKAEGLKPNTKYYAFFDDVRVNDWICPDQRVKRSEFPDNISRYSGAPNDEPKGFGEPLVSDGIGNLQGVFIIPGGRKPVQGSLFTGSMDDIEYEPSGGVRKFETGQATFKLSTDRRIDANTTDIQAYASAEFVSRPVIHDKTDSIVSTRLPQYATNRVLQEDVRFNYGGGSDSDFDPSSVPAPIPNTYDPIAQTFIVDRNNPDGVFVTELDLFFKKKDETRGIEAYIVTTEGGIPTSTIVPHSVSYKETDTVIRVRCNLIDNLSSTVIEEGVRVKGRESGATGIVKSNVRFDSVGSNSAKNVTNHVYNLVLLNYEGEFLPGERLVPQTNPKNENRFIVVEDEVEVTRVDIIKMGRRYVDGDYEIEFDEPQLPGGVRATAELKIADNLKGVVYDVRVTNSGSGYTKEPGVTVKLKDGVSGAGDKCKLRARIRPGRKSVSMGVATSDDASVPTTFKFDAPVYLLGNKTYAVVLKSPASTDYRVWTAKIGEKQIGTDKKVQSQPNTGALFRSQNFGVWTEEQRVDMTFNLRRAKFDTNEVSRTWLTE